MSLRLAAFMFPLLRLSGAPPSTSDQRSLQAARAPCAAPISESEELFTDLTSTLFCFIIILKQPRLHLLIFVLLYLQKLLRSGMALSDPTFVVLLHSSM